MGNDQSIQPSQFDTNPSYIIDDKKRENSILNKSLYAGFWIRFCSYIIDLLILWGISSMLFKPLLTLTGTEDLKLWINALSVDNTLNALLYFSYFILMTYFFHQTLGKMILGIEVIRKDFTPLKWSDVIFREWVGRIISNVMFGLPYVVICFTSRHIGLHDYFADSLVVKKKYLDDFIK